MQNLWKIAAVLRIRMIFVVMVGLLVAGAGCSEYKPAGPIEGEPQKVEASSEKTG